MKYKTIAAKRTGDLAWLYPPQARCIDFDAVSPDAIVQRTDVGVEMGNVLELYPWLTLAEASRMGKRRLRRAGR